MCFTTKNITYGFAICWISSSDRYWLRSLAFNITGLYLNRDILIDHWDIFRGTVSTLISNNNMARFWKHHSKDNVTKQNKVYAPNKYASFRSPSWAMIIYFRSLQEYGCVITRLVKLKRSLFMVLEHALQYVNGDEWDNKTVCAVYFKLYGIGMWSGIFQPSERL